MVGVTSPLLRTDRKDGVRLMATYALGTVLAGVVLVVLLTPLASAAQAALPARERALAAAVAVLVLGLLDLSGHTPHVHRQTPQRLARLPRAGHTAVAGIVAGFDIGLLVTTIKVSSLMWAALVWATLAGPGALPWVVAVHAGVALALHTALSIGGALSHPLRVFEALGGVNVRAVQALAGVLLLGLAAGSALGLC